MITHFKIYGERCSGTNYLHNVLEKNFDLKLCQKYGNKHFFKFREYDEDEKNVLFIGIARDVYHWINSFWKCPYHLPKSLTEDVNSFLTNEFYSINENDGDSEIMTDRNIYKNRFRYKNVMEARSLKTKFLIKELPKHVSHYIFISYEDLKNNFENVMKRLQTEFNLTVISEDFPENVTTYKKSKEQFVPRPEKEYEITREMLTKHPDYDENTELLFTSKKIE